MGAEGWLFLFAVLASAALLFSMVFYIILFSDLECDYVCFGKMFKMKKREREAD